MAQVTKDYFEGSPRKAEMVLGWSRKTVLKGLKELETGIICADNYRRRARKKTLVSGFFRHHYSWRI
jgi:hypothetical protein